MLEGEIRAERPEPDGSWTLVGIARAGEGFGETPLLTGKTEFGILALRPRSDSVLVRFTEEEFWKLLACCPGGAQSGAGQYGAAAAGLPGGGAAPGEAGLAGDLAAGLMHELHNPGSAAKRAASQLRENLMRLQELSLRIGVQAQDASAARIACTVCWSTRCAAAMRRH